MSALAKLLLLTFVLPTGVLLRHMGVRRSELLPNRFDVAGTITLTGDEARRAATGLGLPAQDPLTVSAKFGFSSGKCTLEVAGAQRVIATNTGGQVSVEPSQSGQADEFAGWLVRLGCLPFLFHGEGAENSLESFFRKAGGDPEEAALTLEGGEIAYVLGAGEAGTGKVGLVVQKSGLVPLRTWETEGNTRVDLLFRDYRPVFHDGGFPLSLELRTGGATVARFAANL